MYFRAQTLQVLRSCGESPPVFAAAFLARAIFRIGARLQVVEATVSGEIVRLPCVTVLGTRFANIARARPITLRARPGFAGHEITVASGQTTVLVAGTPL